MEILIASSLTIEGVAAHILLGLLEILFIFLHVPILLGLILRIDLLMFQLVVTVWLLRRRKVKLLMLTRSLIER